MERMNPERAEELQKVLRGSAEYSALYDLLIDAFSHPTSPLALFGPEESDKIISDKIAYVVCGLQDQYDSLYLCDKELVSDEMMPIVAARAEKGPVEIAGGDAIWISTEGVEEIAQKAVSLLERPLPTY